MVKVANLNTTTNNEYINTNLIFEFSLRVSAIQTLPAVRMAGIKQSAAKCLLCGRRGVCRLTFSDSECCIDLKSEMLVATGAVVANEVCQYAIPRDN